MAFNITIHHKITHKIYLTQPFFMTPSQLKKLRSKLPPRSITEIHKETGIPQSTISMVLKGYRQNPIVIEKAIQKAQQYKLLLKAQLEKIDQL